MPPPTLKACTLMPSKPSSARAADGEHQADRGGEADGLERHPAAVGVVGAFGEAREHRQQRQRLDDHQQDHEEFDQFVEHWQCGDSET